MENIFELHVFIEKIRQASITTTTRYVLSHLASPRALWSGKCGRDKTMNVIRLD